MRARFVMGLAAAGLMVLASPAAAQADTASAFCNAQSVFGTHNVSAEGHYFTSGANHVWSDAGFAIGGDHTGGKSNVNATLYVNGGGVWDYNSPDSLQHGVWYAVGMGVTVNAAASEYMNFQAIFDVAGPDPRCNARTPAV